MEDNIFTLRLELIADPVNRRILDQIMETSKYPDDVAREIGFTRSALEQRLKKLIEADFIRKAVEQNLGGRDSLILANFLANKTPTLYTHDKELLDLKNVKWRDFVMKIEDPLTKVNN